MFALWKGLSQTALALAESRRRGRGRSVALRASGKGEGARLTAVRTFNRRPPRHYRARAIGRRGEGDFDGRDEGDGRAGDQTFLFACAFYAHLLILPACAKD